MVGCPFTCYILSFPTEVYIHQRGCSVGLLHLVPATSPLPSCSTGVDPNLCTTNGSLLGCRDSRAQVAPAGIHHR
jgi:hypothetical protein